MGERKPKMRYDYILLQDFCKKNSIELSEDYTKENVVRDTIIKAKCLNCNDICSKNFLLFIEVGCFCNKCAVNKGKKSKINIFGKVWLRNSITK